MTSQLEDPEPQQIDSINVDVHESSVQSREPKRKFRSIVWQHFVLDDVKGKKMAICNYCKKPFSASSGTKNLHDHFKICKMRFGQKRVDILQNRLIGKMPHSDRNVMGSSCLTLTTQHFDNDCSRSELARMIVMHDYPLSMVEHEGFRDFCLALQPLFKHVCRKTIRGDILRMYEEEKAKVMRLLTNIPGRVAITSDMWTATNQKKGYMTVTAHFIDESWHLQSRLLRFLYVPCPHTAENLSNPLLNCMLDWNIDRKLSTLTLDNCSTNNCMIDLLLDKLVPSSLIMFGQLFHMRCAAHILNLIVKNGLDVIDCGVEKIRDSIAFWTATPKRLEKFEEAARQLNLDYSKRLVLDCKTRWNSTYLMLSVALNYKDVFYRLKQRESQYRNLPEEKDWDLAKEMCDRLKIFYHVTEMFSGTKYPTSNLFFPKICEIKLSLRKWLTSSYVEISNMASNMISKFDQYWKDVHGVMAMASLLDPRFKLKLLEYFFPLIYGDDRALEEIANVRKLCEDIFKDYQSRVVLQVSNVDNSGISNLNVNFGGETESLDAFFSWNIEASTVNEKSEFDSYLEEKTLPGTHDFDVLCWWKTNGIKYPIMCEIARDILAIPVSTVASESSFSTSGRIVSSHRNRLLPSTLEAIMCTQNWLWAGKRGNVVDGVGDMLVDEENDMTEESDVVDG